MTERRPVRGYEGRYEVSDEGDIYVIPTVRCRGRRRVEIKLKAHLAANGYMMVLLSLNNVRRNYSVHSVVCSAFHGPKPSPEHQVAHNNSVKTDNRSVNLRWATPKENMADAVRLGTIPHGSRQPMAKLSEGVAKQIFLRLASGERAPDLAAEFGVCQATVYYIRSGHRWRRATEALVAEAA